MKRLVLLLCLTALIGGAPAHAQDDLKTLDDYVKDLAHANPEVRIKALQILGAARKAEALPKLLTLVIKDQNASVRLEAVNALGNFDTTDAKVLAGLTTALSKDVAAPVRGAAAQTFMELGPKAKPAAAALREALKDADALVRVHAARALWNLDPKTAEPLPVLMAALTDKQVVVRNWACYHLTALGPAGKTAAPALREVMRADTPLTRVFAARALWQVAADPEALWALVDLTRAAAVDARERAEQTLLALGDSVLPTLRAGLSAKEPGRRRQAVWALGTLRDQTEPALRSLLSALGDADQQVRGAAVEVLARSGPAAVPSLLQAVAHQNDTIAIGALMALRQTPDVDAKLALPHLLPLLKHKNAAIRVRAAAFVWDGQGDAQVVLPVFRVGTKDADADVRFAAVRGLAPLIWQGTPEGKAAVTLLHERLGDADLDVRRGAVRALTATSAMSPAEDKGDSPFGPPGQVANPGLRDPVVLAALIGRLQEGDEVIDRYLVPALAREGGAGKAAVAALATRLTSKQPLVRREAARALGRIGPDARASVPALVKALQGDDPALRQMAVLALGGIGADAVTAVEELAGLLKDRDGALRLSVLDTLTRLGPAAKRAVPALTSFLRARMVVPNLPSGDAGTQVPQLDGGVRLVAPGGEFVVALDALGAIGPDAAPVTGLLLQIVWSKNPERGRGAVSALARIDKATLPELANAVGKAGPDVRGHFLDVLVDRDFDATLVVPHLLEGLGEDSPEVRQRAAFNLGRLGPQAVVAVKPLMSLVADQKQEEDLRGTAAQALGEIGPAAREALPVLRAALKDEAPYVRQWAAFALGEFGVEARAALPQLNELLKDRDGNVRKAAAVAVKKIGKGS